MKEENIVGCLFVGMLIIVFSIFVGWAIGWNGGQASIRHEAAKGGYAEYIANKDGESTFTWKENK